MQSHHLGFNRILNSPNQTPLFILEYILVAMKWKIPQNVWLTTRIMIEFNKIKG